MLPANRYLFIYLILFYVTYSKTLGFCSWRLKLLWTLPPRGYITQYGRVRETKTNFLTKRIKSFLKKVSYFTYSKTFAFVVEDCCYNGHFLAADNRVWEGQWNKEWLEYFQCGRFGNSETRWIGHGKCTCYPASGGIRNLGHNHSFSSHVTVIQLKYRCLVVNWMP